MLSNFSYRHNMERLREMMRDQPQTSLERAVWWTEYVLRHGGAKHLRAAGANRSWSDYLMVDVIGVIFGSICFLLVVFYGVLRVVTKRFIVKVKQQ